MKQTQGVLYLNEKRFRLPLAHITKIEEIEIVDVFLHQNQEYHLQKQTDEVFILIPFVGDVLCAGNLLEETEVQILFENQVFLKNPYHDVPINLLLIKKPLNGEIAQKIWINMQENKNLLISISENISVGQFDGRQEAIYELKQNKNNVIAFVLNGAFEVANRLLSSRDAVLLQSLNVVEFEALSNEAVIIFLAI